jgi:hypothetical protein
MQGRRPPARGGPLLAIPGHVTRLAWLLALSILAGGCGSSTSRPGPTEARQPRDAFVPVPFPPPPGRVEFAPQAPRPDAVWISGEWSYRFGRWSWTFGRWVVPPRGAVGHAPWALRRDAAGELWFAPGAWRDARGELVDPPQPLAVATARERAVTEEDGTLQSVGPNMQPPPPIPAE